MKQAIYSFKRVTNHQEWSGLVHHFIRNIISQGLKVMLDRDFALCSKLLDFLRTLVFPVLDILIGADTERTTL